VHINQIMRIKNNYNSYNNNKNNNNLLQLCCHPMAVVTLHLYKIWNWLLLNLSWGLYEKHVVANWNLENHLSICL